MKTKCIERFINETASDSATPGGGSVASLVASLSASLVSMSASLTIGKKGYENEQEKMKMLANKFKEKANVYLDYINKDIKVFNEVMASYKLKKDSEEEKKYRSQKIQEKTLQALLVPYELALDIYDLLDEMEYCYYFSNKNIKSDALLAVILARSAILSCLCNVYINLNSLKDEEFKQVVDKKCNLMKEKVIKLEKKLINDSSYFKID